MIQLTRPSRTIVHAAFATCLTAIVQPCNAASPLDPSGTWLPEDGRARVRVEWCGAKREQVCGFIVWMKTPVDSGGRAVQDQNNPDPEKRSRLVLGHQLIMGLTPGSDGRFYGQIYNAENGQSYEISLWRDRDKLTVKGCMLAFICAVQNWSQTTDVQPGQLVGMTGDPMGPRLDKGWTQVTQAKPAPIAKATK
jgi:uncharacterized protein (DUF2147 family)